MPDERILFTSEPPLSEYPSDETPLDEFEDYIDGEV